MGSDTQSLIVTKEKECKELEREHERYMSEKDKALKESIRNFQLLEEEMNIVRVSMKVTEKKIGEQESKCRNLEDENRKLRCEKDKTLQESIMNTHNLEEELKIMRLSAKDTEKRNEDNERKREVVVDQNRKLVLEKEKAVQEKDDALHQKEESIRNFRKLEVEMKKLIGQKKHALQELSKKK